MKKVPESEVNALIDDEKMAHENYQRLGVPSLAKDELRHYHFWLNYRKKTYGY